MIGKESIRTIPFCDMRTGMQNLRSGGRNDGCWEENKDGKDNSKTHVHRADDGDSTYDSDHLYPGTDGASDSNQPGTDQPDKPCHFLYGVYSRNEAFRSELCIIPALRNSRTSGILRIYRRCR